MKLTLQLANTTLTLTGEVSYRSRAQRIDYAQYDCTADTHVLSSFAQEPLLEVVLHMRTATTAQVATLRTFAMASKVRLQRFMGHDRDCIVYFDDPRERLQPNRPHDITVRILLTGILTEQQSARIFTNQFSHQFA